MSNLSGFSDLENNNNSRSSQNSQATRGSLPLGNYDAKGRFNPWMPKALTPQPQSGSTGYAQLGSQMPQSGNGTIGTFSSIGGVHLKLKSFSAINLIAIWVIFLLSNIPSLVSDVKYPCVLFQLGALYQPSITHSYQYHRLFMPIVLHLNFLHILSNSIGLFLYSFTLEHRYGTKKFIAYYLICGLGGHLLSSIKYFNILSVGASACIFGLFPFMLVFVLDNPAMSQAQKTLFGVYIVIQVISSFLPKQPNNNGSDSSPQNDIVVNHYAHLGGVITGVLICVIISERQNIPNLKYWKILAKVILVVSLIGLFFFNLFNPDVPLPAEMVNSCS